MSDKKQDKKEKNSKQAYDTAGVTVTRDESPVLTNRDYSNEENLLKKVNPKRVS